MTPDTIKQQRDGLLAHSKAVLTAVNESIDATDDEQSGKDIAAAFVQLDATVASIEGRAA